MKALSDLADACSSPAWKETFIACFGNIIDAINALAEDLSADNIRRLNGAWAIANRAYNQYFKLIAGDHDDA